MLSSISNSVKDSYREYIGHRRGLGSYIYQLSIVVALLILIGIPTVFFLWGSVWSEAPGLGGHFTLEGFEEIFRPGVYETISNTIILAVGGTFLALAMGISAMVFTIKTDMKGGWIISFFLIIQYLLPSFLLGLSWRFYAGPNGPLNQLLMLLPFVNSPPIDIYGIWGITFVAATHYAGLVYLLSSGAVKAIPASMEETAEISGASAFTIIKEIIIKLAMPSLLISMVIIFTRLVQSFGLPLILGIRGNTYVMATHMYIALEEYPPNFNFAAALGVLILVLTLVGLALQRAISGSREKYEVISGSGQQTRDRNLDLGRFSSVISAAFLVFVVLVYLMPIITLFISSFQQTFLGFKFDKIQWTLDNYRNLFIGTHAGGFYKAAKNSLILSGVGGFVGMLFAVIVSYIIVKVDSSLSDIVDFMSMTPIAIPGIIFGTAYLWLWLEFNILGLYGTIWLIMIALIAKFLLYGTRAGNSSLRSIGEELEEAAEIGGSNRFTLFRKIFLPLMTPGFIAGYVILFVDFMKVLSIPLLLGSGNSEVIQVLTWRLYLEQDMGAIAAIGVLIILTISLIYGIAHLFTDADVTSI